MEKISFLEKCLENSVLSHNIKVKKVRPSFAASIGRAFVKDEIATQHEKLERVCLNFRNVTPKVSYFLSFFD